MRCGIKAHDMDGAARGLPGNNATTAAIRLFKAPDPDRRAAGRNQQIRTHGGILDGDLIADFDFNRLAFIGFVPDLPIIQRELALVPDQVLDGNDSGLDAAGRGFLLALTEIFCRCGKHGGLVKRTRRKGFVVAGQSLSIVRQHGTVLLIGSSGVRRRGHCRAGNQGD
jgi:hypothetical protein